MTIETQEDRDKVCTQAFKSLMETVRSLGATQEQCDSVIRDIVTYGHHKEWSGWYTGFNSGYAAARNRFTG